MVLGHYVDDSQLGEWRKERPLGRGGFGAITLWRNMVTGDSVAVKCCTKSASEMSARNHERWAQEVEILQKLDHPNVVKGLAVPKEFEPLSLSSSLPFMVMEYCNGGDLRKVLSRPENCRGLKEKEVCRVLKDVTSAIAYLHKHRIIHRDLKPENIVLQDQAGEVVYKLIDLGYAKELDQNSICSSFVGTLQYLAPELFTREPYTSSVDYWSLGIVAYEVASGTRPFFPNEGPPIWVPCVNQKGSSHIAGELNVNGDPVYSSTLPLSTHLTRILKAELATWLQVLLQLDPQRRGRKNGVSAYDLLENILSQQVAHIFSATKLSVTTVPRSDASTLSDITRQTFADRTTPEANLLLMDKGVVAPEDIWTACADLRDPAITLYLFELSMDQSNCESYRPEYLLDVINVVSRCEEDRHVQANVKHLWAEGIFCVQQEVANCQQLLYAYQTFLNYIKAQNKALQSEVVQVVAEMTAASAKMKFAHECFVMDVESLQRLRRESTSSAVDRLIKDWSCCDDLLIPVDYENQAIKAVQKRASELAVRVAEYEKTPFALSKQPIVLKDKLNGILEQYADAKKKMRETQCFIALCHKLHSGLVDFVQEEGRFVEECQNYMRQMCALLKDIQSLSPELRSHVEHIHTLSWKVSSQQRKRQETIWNLQRKSVYTSATPQEKDVLGSCSAKSECSSTASLRDAVEHCLSSSAKTRLDSDVLLLKVESALSGMMTSGSFHTCEL
ncbi:inhibitor of nuclear factor kappa-B kinase subunit alpha-like [Ornithodoros turicata]|uniref:inhibitor of nuclear factor kappa-B kinase subunit alpha-like n=1 Tax=Ornithodoros turicata TaxID=34597 RepID=UPI003139AC2A